MKIALAQIDTTVGDLAGNADRIVAAADSARRSGAECVVFPELTLTGYPPRDLLDRASFVDATVAALRALAPRLEGVAALVGHVERNPGPGRALFNSVSLLDGGRIVSTHRKTLLPTYDVFDEDRHFEPSAERSVAVVRGRRIGVTICEDIWTDDESSPRRGLYRVDPVSEMKGLGAELVVNVSASPWQIGKERTRVAVARRAAARAGLPLALANLVGGNDELVFDGTSCLAAADGSLRAVAKSFAEDAIVFDMDRLPAPVPEREPRSDASLVVDALVLGLRDYAAKCGFSRAVVGLSGGIDSSLVAVLAEAALGRENVLGVAMPSPFNAPESLEDARRLAENLGISFETIPITRAYETALETLAPYVAGGEPSADLARQNLQARLRGLVLMAISNRTGAIVLSTGNKSELAVGYCTLYGDMAGGLAVISDVPKMLVYAAAAEANRRAGREIVPARVFTKAPSAELRPDQKDTDSLPEYPVLDALLKAAIEEHASEAEMVARGLADEATVRDVVRRLYASEYKRRQAAPGLKVTSKAFGVGRRMPIAQRFRG
jgi:NAD+ synthetase